MQATLFNCKQTQLF